MVCQQHAGVLTSELKLSRKAKKMFVEDVKNELVFGSAALPPAPLPCGPTLPPVPFADQLQLEDEKKFPEFHKHVLGLYEEIAKGLNSKGQFTILPIVDPLALAVRLDVKPPRLKFPKDFAIYGVSLPLLAVKLKFKPPKLAAKFPSIVSPPIPQLNLPLPIDIKVPDFKALYEFSLWPLKLPNIIVDLMAQMPSLFLKMLQFDLSAFCDPILNSKVFGDFNPSESLVWAAATKVLARKTAECVSICVAANTVGSAPGGVVGNLGKKYGYDPMPQETGEDDVRSLVVEAALSMDGQSWSRDRQALAEVDNDFERVELPYTNFILPTDVSPKLQPGETPKPFNKGDFNSGLKSAFQRAKSYSSCGLFVRGCYFSAGALDPVGTEYFETPYRESTALSGLVSIAHKRGALVSFSGHEIPSLKKGDAILTHDPNRPGREHVLMLTEDFPGGSDSDAHGIQGGSVDLGNAGAPTAISRSTFKFFTSGGRVLAGSTLSEAREVLKLIDAEKICLNE